MNTKVIYSAKLARELIKKGFKVVDIKPDRTDVDKKRTVFIFEVTDELLVNIPQSDSNIKNYTL